MKYGGIGLLLENLHLGGIVMITKTFAAESTCETCLENENMNGELMLGWHLSVVLCFRLRKKQ